MLSQDWVLDCIDNEEVLGMEDYLVEVGDDVGAEDVQMYVNGGAGKEEEMGMNSTSEGMNSLKRKLANEGERETKRQMPAAR